MERVRLEASIAPDWWRGPRSEIKSAFKDADYKGGIETILKESTLLAVIGK